MVLQNEWRAYYPKGAGDGNLGIPSRLGHTVRLGGTTGNTVNFLAVICPTTKKFVARNLHLSSAGNETTFRCYPQPVGSEVSISMRQPRACAS